MASSRTGNTEVDSDLSDIKRKLAKRMGIAGLMIVGLLGGLAVFDRLSAPNDSDTSPAPQFSEPVPVVKKMQTQPVTPAVPSVEPPKDNKVVAEPEFTAPPVGKAGVGVGLPPPPEVMSQPVIPRAKTPVGHPVSGTVQPGPGPEPSKVLKPARPVETSKPFETTKPVEAAKPVEGSKRPEPVKQAESSRPSAVNKATEPEKQPRAVVESSAPPVAVVPSVTLPRLSSGYALQVGVFSDPRRAEELHARLTQEGIPAFIEARVEVGPFKSKEEADAARAKLHVLGVDSVLLSPKTKR